MSSHYRIADRIVASAIPLPELAPAAATGADWRVARACSPALCRRGRAYHHWNTPSGYRWATFRRDGEHRVMHFARTAQFVVEFEARRVTCHAIGSTDEDTWRPVLLNQLFPLLLAEDRLVLHASAVATPRGAVVFAGAPGQGKSTLATALALRGLPLISDDFLVIDQSGAAPLALPSGVAPRLWPDSVDAILPGRRRHFPLVGRRSTKRRISAGVPLAAQALPIARVFLLTLPALTSRVAPVARVAAVPALTASAFVARIDERTVVRDTFERVTSLVARVPIHSLAALREYSQLDYVSAMLHDVARSY